MRFERRFTRSGQSAYADIAFRAATSEIRNPDGSVVFRLENIEVPEAWSQVAADVLAQKYFRKAGVPARLKKVEETSLPSWLWRSVPDEKALAGQGPVMVLRCLHLANGRPFALEDRIINLKAVPAAAAADFSVEPPGTWLLVHVPWTEAEHRITAVNADAATSEILDVPAGEACLLLERRTWRGKANITSVRQTFVGATYDLIARFTSKSMAPQKHSAV